MFIHRLTRRAVLEGIAKTTLVLPALPSLLSAKERKQLEHEKNLRFLAIHSPRGRIMQHWLPDFSRLGTPTTTTLQYEQYDLSKLEGALSLTLNHSYFSQIKDKILLLKGLDYVHGMPSGTHYAPFMLNSYYEGKPLRAGKDRYMETIDQTIALAPRTYSQEPKTKSLHLAVATSLHESSVDELKTISIRLGPQGEAIDIAPTLNPHLAFQQLFAAPKQDGFTKAMNLRVVDTVLEDFKSLKRQSYIANADVKTIEAHLAFLRELEQRLEARQENVCLNESASPDIASKEMYAVPDIPGLIDCHSRLIVAAFACGLTRVATLMMEVGDHALPFTGVNRPHHSLSHGAGENWMEKKLMIDQWFAMKVAELLAQLENQNLLDETLVYWGSEFSDGKVHSRYDMPVFLAGAKNYLNTGRLLNYQRGPEGVGRAYNEFLIGIMIAMGLQPSDWEKGEPGFGYYGVNVDGRRYDLGNKREALPGMLR